MGYKCLYLFVISTHELFNNRDGKEMILSLLLMKNEERVCNNFMKRQVVNVFIVSNCEHMLSSLKGIRHGYF